MRAKLVITKEKKPKESTASTHPHASAVHMNMLCKSRFQLLLHKESTFDGPRSCQSDPFCLSLVND